MPQQFEPQTEQQPHSYVSPNVAAPSRSATQEMHNAQDTLSTPETVTQPIQEQAFVPTVGANWQALLQQWQQESRGNLLDKLPWLSGGMMGLAVPIFFLMSAASFPVEYIYTFVFLPWLCLWGLILAVGIRRQNRLKPSATAILNGLEVVEDTAAVGPLLEAWQAAATNGRGRAELGTVLTHLLPRLRKENGTELTKQQRRILYDNISHAKSLHHPELTLVCMDAIEQIGDHHALPLLARLIVHDAPSQTEQRIRERSQQCLTYLTQTLDFGTTADIPKWIAKLPYTSSSSNLPILPAGADDALIALFALIRLLPQLQPSDAGFLKASEREYMAESWRWILHALSPGLSSSNLIQQSRLGSAYSLAVLDALEQIGTGRDLYLSYWLLRDVPTEEQPLLREKAHHVHTVLKQRQEREKIGHTLLRGSSAPIAAPGELLRPANAEQSHSDPKELLRPEGEKRGGC